MSTAKIRPNSSRKPSGTVQASVPGFVLLKVKAGGRAARQATPKADSASSLLDKVGKALAKPGLDAGYVFSKSRQGNKPVYAYSIDPTDTARLIRTGEDGSRKVGRLVNNRFIEIKPPTAKAA